MKKDFKDLDPLLHSQLRLSIISILIGVKEAEFTFIRETTGATSGNVSVQVSKLEEAGYVTVKKEFKNNYPCTTLSITEKGIKAFEDYVNNLKSYINIKK
ncbi:MAG TPA: transcriptional regulator [Bacteroidia bacterium]|jgi:DNA-binding MarR family transcriptional regulator|nr:transcriptional regulator [Bacteroidia bacterium]